MPCRQRHTALGSELGHRTPKQVQKIDSTVNAHDCKLMRLCEDTAIVLCTGRISYTHQRSLASRRAATLSPLSLTMSLALASSPTTQDCSVQGLSQITILLSFA